MASGALRWAARCRQLRPTQERCLGCTWERDARQVRPDIASPTDLVSDSLKTGPKRTDVWSMIYKDMGRLQRRLFPALGHLRVLEGCACYCLAHGVRSGQSYPHQRQEAVQQVDGQDEGLRAVAEEAAQAPQVLHLGVSALSRDPRAVLEAHKQGQLTDNQGEGWYTNE